MAIPIHMLPGWRGSETVLKPPAPTREASSVMRVMRLQIGSVYFSCPYCFRHWQRGGKKEGFVKSGANNHVAMCQEIVAWILGYAMWDTTAVFDREKAFPRNRRRILSAIAVRKRDGYLPDAHRFRRA